MNFLKRVQVPPELTDQNASPDVLAQYEYITIRYNNIWMFF